MTDLLDRVRHDINARIAELRPFVDELARLEAAHTALQANGTRTSAPTPPTSRPQRARAKARAPRGANRTAILAVIEERPGVSVGEIAAVTKITRATVATTVSKLKRDGTLDASGSGVRLAAS